MLTFYPELDFKESESLNVVLLVDCSNSMKGQPFSDALKVKQAIFHIFTFILRSKWVTHNFLLKCLYQRHYIKIIEVIHVFRY